MLMFLEARRAALRRVRHGEVQMKPSVDVAFVSQFSSALGVGHKNHGTYRRNCSGSKTIVRSIRREAIAAPIIGVHNHLSIVECHGSGCMHDADLLTNKSALAFSDCDLLVRYTHVSLCAERDAIEPR